MAASKPFTPSASQLQEIFDDLPYIEQDFLWEVRLAQECFFKDRKKWESAAGLLDKMLESGLPVEPGQLEVHRIEHELRFDIVELWPWVPPDIERSRALLKVWETFSDDRARAKAERLERFKQRNRVLRRLGLPELEHD